jgi:transcription termination/antitermination protein NusA
MEGNVNREIIEALHQIEKEKGIAFETLLSALEDALHSAYKKTPDAVDHAKVEIDPESGEMKVYELTFPDHVDVDALKVLNEDGDEIGIDLSGIDESEVERHEIEPDDFGRIAAQTAKQVILQRIREAERDLMYDEYVDRVGDLVTGIVQQSDSRYTLVDLGRVEALLPKSEQIETERYDHGARIKAVIIKVQNSTKGPQVILSRRSDEIVHRLFELEVPEIADGLVEIRNVAREPGYRCKIAVISHTDGVDPVGACVGPRGSRVRMVVSELRGERIDIVPYNDEPARFVAKALSPARVREVLVDDEERSATIIVPDDQLSLAIGKEGQNARLASKLTGWRIDIKSQTEMAEGGEEELTFASGDEDLTGRCIALTGGGKRCPNMALPGTRYCGIPAHQKLAQSDTGADVETDAETGDAGTVEAEAVVDESAVADATAGDAESEET